MPNKPSLFVLVCLLHQIGSQLSGGTRVLSAKTAKLTTAKQQEDNVMKMNQLLAACGITAALFLGAGNVSAQDNGGGNNGGNGNRPGRGNFDPAQMQQRMMDRYRQDLNYTNDTEWSAVEPLIQKVMDARMAIGRGGFGRGGRGGGAPGGQPGGGAFGQQPNPERDALQKAIDDNAPAAQIKELLAKYEASQKAKQAKLVAAQADLRKVFTVTQEAQATLSGLLE
jgi:hypothetical protein